MNLSDSAVARVRSALGTLGDSIRELEAIFGAGPESPEPTHDLASSSMVGSFEIVDRTPFEKFTYRWPTGETSYVNTIKYTVRRNDSDDFFAVGEEEGGRPSYQREDRGRIVVFIRSKARENSYYPLVEFAETDDDPDTFAAIVPNPESPRSGTTEADIDQLRLVPHLEHAELERADRVFRSLRNAPSLRLLARRDDPKLMIEHAWWVGTLRGTGTG